MGPSPLRASRIVLCLVPGAHRGQGLGVEKNSPSELNCHIFLVSPHMPLKSLLYGEEGELSLLILLQARDDGQAPSHSLHNT